MKRAIAYTRVSTKHQVVKGVSLNVQREKIKEWARVHDYDLIKVYCDAGISGYKKRTRPEFDNAVEAACRLKAALVVYSLSRFARSTVDIILISERLNKAGADLVSLSEKIDTTSAMGKMIFRMLAVLAEFESDVISERVTSAMAHLRKQKRRISRWIPYGFKLGPNKKYLIPDSKEQRTIHLIIKLRKDGYTLKRIASELNKLGIKTKLNHRWTPRSIFHVLHLKKAV